jgi:hypothetical protein
MLFGDRVSADLAGCAIGQRWNDLAADLVDSLVVEVAGQLGATIV